jgi:hypothetical protein
MEEVRSMILRLAICGPTLAWLTRMLLAVPVDVIGHSVRGI